VDRARRGHPRRYRRNRRVHCGHGTRDVPVRFKTVRAVELNLIIIGEAASRIPDDIQATYSEIPWSFMKAMRNRLVHAYFNVDAQILWDTVQDDLPTLKAALLLLLASPPPASELEAEDS
jgi:uncharacterized protein with HEPN domain